MWYLGRFSAQNQRPIPWHVRCYPHSTLGSLAGCICAPARTSGSFARGRGSMQFADKRLSLHAGNLTSSFLIFFTLVWSLSFVGCRGLVATPPPQDKDFTLALSPSAITADPGSSTST